MLVRSKGSWRLAVCALIVASSAACASTQPEPTEQVSTTPTPASPFFSTPPSALGNGLVCAAAADRLLGIADGLHLRQFTRGVAKPRNPTIQLALAHYLATTDPTIRQRAAGLIQGQCAAYGFYATTYQECIQSSASRSLSIDEAARRCIDRRKWTVYTQQ